MLGVRGGLSVDHLVVAHDGAGFDHLGGPGLYAALGGRLVGGTSVRLATNLPEGDRRFRDLFGELGIDVEHSATVPTVPRVWILNSPEGRRIVETAPSGGVELDAGEALDGHEAELPDSVAFLSGVSALLDSSPTARPGAAVTAGIDPHQLLLRREGIGYLHRVTPPGGVVLPSRVQLRLIDDDPRAAARRICAEVGVPVIARLDAEGLYVVSSEGTWSVRDSQVEVRETTGAGDSSAAAIMAALAGGADLVTAAAYGASIARIALSAWGADALATAAPRDRPFPDIRSNQES